MTRNDDNRDHQESILLNPLFNYTNLYFDFPVSTTLTKTLMCSIEYETARWSGCREFGFSKLNCSAAAAGKGPRSTAHPPPPQIFLHLWVWICCHLSFQSTDKPLLNRTEQQFNFCDPFQILPSSPTPIHIQIQKQPLKSLRPLFPWIEFHGYFQLIGIFILFSF